MPESQIEQAELRKFSFFVLEFFGVLRKVSLSWTQKILNLLLQDKIDKLYIDTDVLNRGGKYHLEFNTLKKYIPKNLRSHVVCMHLHDNCNKQKIKKEGFDLPELI